MINDNRYGKFRISIKLMEENPIIVMRIIMSNFLVTRAECIYGLGVIQYEAYSPLFRKIEVGERPPLYVIGFDEEENISVTEEAE